MVLDINDFPSFGLVPGAAWQLARTLLRLARAAQPTTTTTTTAPAATTASRTALAGIEATA